MTSEPEALPQAVLWDLDGTLVDTEPYWFAAEYAAIESHGGQWSDEHAASLIGSDLLTAAQVMRRLTGITVAPEQLVDEIVQRVIAQIRVAIPWRPGAAQLLAELRTAAVPCALVTMSYRILAEAVVAALPAGTFDVLITGDEVEHGKPHPEPYLTAAAKLGVPPRSCIALEDSRTGLASAEAAGVPVVVVEHMQKIEPGPGRVILATLEGVTPARLAALAGIVRQS